MFCPSGGENEPSDRQAGETQQGERVSWPHGPLSVSLGVSMGVGQLLGGSSVQATSTKWCASPGVCAEGSRINRRLPVLGDTGARWLPAPGVSLLCNQAACCVVSLPPGSGISFQAPSRCQGPGRAQRRSLKTLPGAALPLTAQLMDPTAPGSSVSSLPLLLALALGKCSF